MEMTDRNLLLPLIGQMVTSVGRVTLENAEGSTALDDTLVLRLAGGRLFEFLCRQDTVLFDALNGPGELFADFALEPDERLGVSEVDTIALPHPFMIASVTETWAGEEERRFLVALRFHDDERRTLLCLCTETPSGGADATGSRFAGADRTRGQRELFSFPGARDAGGPPLAVRLARGPLRLRRASLHAER